MVKREDRKSAVINISSVSALLKDPESQIYAASKQFVACFTECLSKAPVYKDIDFLNLYAGSVKTNMNEGTIMMCVDPYNYAKSSLRHLGYENYDFGHWKHHVYMSMIYNPLTSQMVYNNYLEHRGTFGNKVHQNPVE